MTEQVRIEVASAARMRELGTELAAQLRRGDLLVLTGPLGAGKTTLVQGIGEGLGVRGPITSPTFVIARVHPNLAEGPDLVHADAYRLGSRLEVDDLDLDADTGRCVTVVEWGAGLVEELAAERLEVSIDWAASTRSAQSAAAPAADSGDEPRDVTVTAVGERWAEVLDRIAELAGARRMGFRAGAC
jgi:tRNA threonylcarbamoyladenosine biosynthesis protein TsaE